MEKFDWDIYNTDKIKGHGYDKIYTDYLDRNKTSVIEFGSMYGSAALWKDYFPDANVLCLDIVPFEPPQGVSFRQFDMYNSVEYRDLPDNVDVVIEDGPHTSRSQFIMLEQMIGKLSKDGIIVFEDLHCTEEDNGPFDYFSKHNEDSDITLNKLLREINKGVYNKYKYIDSSFLKNYKLEINFLRGTKVRWPFMKVSSEVIVLKKLD